MNFLCGIEAVSDGVSVPLIGDLVFNPGCRKSNGGHEGVSVPLIGDLVFNPQSMKLLTGIAFVSVPLIGDLVFNEVNLMSIGEKICFRPLNRGFSF